MYDENNKLETEYKYNKKSKKTIKKKNNKTIRK